MLRYFSRIISTITVFILILASLSFVTPSVSADAPYVFNDPQLEYIFKRDIFGDGDSAEAVTVQEVRSVKTLYISRCELTSLEDIRNMPNLESITFYCCTLPEINADTFSANTLLKSIYFSFCSFEAITGNIFKENTALETISLIQSLLVELPDNVFLSAAQRLQSGALDQLELNLYGNYFSGLKKEWFGSSLSDSEWSLLKDKISYTLGDDIPVSVLTDISSSESSVTQIYGFDEFLNPNGSYTMLLSSLSMLKELSFMTSSELLNARLQNLFEMLEPVQMIQYSTETKQESIFIYELMGNLFRSETSINNATILVDIHKKLFSDLSFTELTSQSYKDAFYRAADSVLPGIKDAVADELFALSCNYLDIVLGTCFGIGSDNIVCDFLVDCIINNTELTEEEFYSQLNKLLNSELSPDSKAIYLINEIRQSYLQPNKAYIYSLDLPEPNKSTSITVTPQIEGLTLVSASFMFQTEDAYVNDPGIKAEIGLNPDGSYSIALPVGISGKALRLSFEYAGPLNSTNRFFKSFDLFIMISDSPDKDYEFKDLSSYDSSSSPVFPGTNNGNAASGIEWSFWDMLPSLTTLSSIFSFAAYLLVAVAIIMAIMCVSMLIYYIKNKKNKQ